MNSITFNASETGNTDAMECFHDGNEEIKNIIDAVHKAVNCQF